MKRESVMGRLRGAPEPDAPQERIGQMLVNRRLISESQLQEALGQDRAAGQPLGVLLVELGMLGERDLAEAVTAELGLPLVDLRQATPSVEAVGLLPEAVARALCAVPVRMLDGRVEVAVADPMGDVPRRLEKEMGHSVELVVAPESDIRRAIDGNYRVLIAVDQHVAAFERAESGRRTSQRAAEAPSDTAPVSQVVQLLITQGFHDRASDIHIEPQDQRIRRRAPSPRP